MRFSASPGTHPSVDKYHIISVERPSISKDTVSRVSYLAAVPCLLELQKPTMELVEMFALRGFGPPSVCGFCLIMYKPFVQPPQDHPLRLRPHLLKQTILTCAGNPFEYKDYQRAYITHHPYGLAYPNEELKQSLDAACFWGILDYCAESRRWKVEKWVLTSLEDDLIDAEARRQGFDA